MIPLNERPIRQVEEYFCPHCRANLRGNSIPVQDQHLFGATHFGREIGHEVMGVYDGVLYLQCPECDGTWQRWSEGSWQYEKAIPYMRRGRIVVEINYNVPKED